ncbi:MAG: hypothetical protein BRD48_07190 [Bacteroidetes bacterium QS_9_68_14]|nr:MAG: hypothetical protein BRD48_07190 [Bacteroidetes bacterium QS_9_68_14]
MSTEPAPEPAAAPAQQAAEPQQAEDARYASQAAAAQPSPVALEGGAAAPGSSPGGTTGRSEWVFLLLAVLFSLVLVAVPAVFFTSFDLTATGAGGAEEQAADGSAEARGLERLQLLQETRADALSKLYTYGPSKEDVARYRIPIERAMRLTVPDSATSAPPADRPTAGGPATPSGSALRSPTPR